MCWSTTRTTVTSTAFSRRASTTTCAKASVFEVAGEALRVQLSTRARMVTHTRLAARHAQPEENGTEWQTVSVPTPPQLPHEMVLRYTDVAEGRIRTRTLGRPRGGVLPVVVVQGMTVSDYLLPGCAALGEWTEVHLLDLPGYAGSGQPTRWLDVRGYGETVVHWLEASGIGRAVVVGHSSGTQGAAWAGVLAPERGHGGGAGQSHGRPEGAVAAEVVVLLASGRAGSFPWARGKPRAGVETCRSTGHRAPDPGASKRPARRPGTSASDAGSRPTRS